MIQDTLKKVNESRLKITLDYDEMLDVKKYMFKELLTLKTNDQELIKKDCEFVNTLQSLDPNGIDRNSLSDLGYAIVFIIFGGYISVVSTKRCGEDFTMTKPVYENENDFKQYECNVMKKMYLKYKNETCNFFSEGTSKMVKQQSEILNMFTENFFIFKLSDNRALLLVNSFFRLYFDNYADKKAFQDLDLTKYTNVPSYLAIAPNSAIFTETRRYRYEIHELDLETAEYFNSLC